MSNRYKGGVISATPPTLVAGAGASGTWTLEQQLQANAAGLWPVNGPFYIEEVFSTWLYTGNGATQTINNGIDLAGKGGLVWIKPRNQGGTDHWLQTSNLGFTNSLKTNSTSQLLSGTNIVGSVSSTGFTDTTPWPVDWTIASWTFRKQPKFFDVVTWTGNDATGRQINHSLGSVPGCIIVKSTQGGILNWYVYHRSLGGTKHILLNTNSASVTSDSAWNNTDPTSTQFTVGLANNYSDPTFGGVYVAYLFAHEAGGFGLTGTDNAISCGSFTTDAEGGALVGPDLGWEPQWVLLKNATSTASGSWWIFDNMRGFSAFNGSTSLLRANSNIAEAASSTFAYATSTGFTVPSNGIANGQTFIYIAIRRGPMKVPTTGTSVYQAEVGNSSSAPEFNAGFPVDMALMKDASGTTEDWFNSARLLQGTYLIPNSTAAADISPNFNFAYQNGWYATATTRTSWMFRRAPGYMDVVCYTGTGVARTVAHNLAAVPELMIVKNRTSAGIWAVYQTDVGATRHLRLNQADASFLNVAVWNNTAPTSTVFTVGTLAAVNGSGNNIVAYLFATCPGVSKVGSFTGTGATQVINCGFTGGARFVLIKATSTTGDWYVWDSVRGIVAGNDPYLVLNSTALQVTGTDWVDTAATGFELSNAGGNLANSSGVSYIFLAIA